MEKETSAKRLQGRSKKRTTTTTTPQVIYMVIHWLRTWLILQKPDLQDTVVAVSQQLMQVVKDFFSQAHGWRSSLRIDSH